MNGTNSKLEKLLGAAGNAVIRLGVRDACKIDINAMAQMTSASDVARPADPVYQPTRPAPWIDAPTVLAGNIVSAAGLTIDVGAQVQMYDDPNEAFGYGPASITQRNITGEILLPKNTESVLNIVSSWSAGTPYAISTYWGTTAGNRVAFVTPAVQFSQFREIDRDGYTYYQSEFRLAPTATYPFALTFF